MTEEQGALAKVAFDANAKSSPAYPPLTVKKPNPPAATSVVSAVAKPNRCLACRKRVGLTGLKSRCGSMFCGPHRYPKQHRFTFDYKAVGKEAIVKANPVVKAEQDMM